MLMVYLLTFGCVLGKRVISFFPSLSLCIFSIVSSSIPSSSSLLSLPLPPPPPPPSSSPADTSAVYPLLESVHGPYCQLLVQYPSMETQLLTQSLRSLQSVSDTYIPSPFHTHTSHTPSPPPLTHMHTHIHTQPLPTSIEDSISLISESVLNVFTCTFEALERCVQLTEGWGICGLIKAIEVGRIRLLSYISNVLCPCQE